MICKPPAVGQTALARLGFVVSYPSRKKRGKDGAPNQLKLFKSVCSYSRVRRPLFDQNAVSGTLICLNPAGTSKCVVSTGAELKLDEVVCVSIRMEGPAF